MGKITEGEREEKKKNGNFPNTMFFFCLFCFFNKKEKPRDKQKNKHKTASFHTHTQTCVLFTFFID